MRPDAVKLDGLNPNLDHQLNAHGIAHVASDVLADPEWQWKAGVAPWDFTCGNDPGIWFRINGASTKPAWLNADSGARTYNDQGDHWYLTRLKPPSSFELFYLDCNDGTYDDNSANDLLWVDALESASYIVNLGDTFSQTNAIDPAKQFRVSVSSVTGNVPSVTLSCSVEPSSSRAACDPPSQVVAAGGTVSFKVNTNPDIREDNDYRVVVKSSVPNMQLDGQVDFGLKVTGRGQDPAINVPNSPFKVEATSRNGAIADYDSQVSFTDPENNIVTKGCSPESGTSFAMDETDVTCTAEDSMHNRATATFKILVSDTTAPVLVVPTSEIRMDATGENSAEVTYSVSASDTVDGDITPVCNHASGSIFRIGATTVECTATDSSGNKDSESFDVYVSSFEDDPPEIDVPDSPVTATAQGPDTSVRVDFVVTATDDHDGNVPVTCDYTSGFAFEIGDTTVNCMAKDSAGNEAEKSFTVRVTKVDTTKPVIVVPSVFTATATSQSGAEVDYSEQVSATDDVDQSVQVVCDPESGIAFKIGDTTVNCFAEDSAKNKAEAQFTVRVTLTDVTEPIIQVPSSPLVVNTTDPAGLTVNYVATATDDSDPQVDAICNPPSGSMFRIGPTLVTCTATDQADNEATASFDIMVVSQTDCAAELAVTQLALAIQGKTVNLSIQSCSEVTDLTLDGENKAIKFKVSGDTGTPGISIVPVSQVLKGPYTVQFDGNAANSYEILTDQTSGEQRIKLSYTHSVHDVAIAGTGIVVPEDGGGGPDLITYGIIGAIAAAAIIGSVVAVAKMKKRKTDVNIP